MSTTQLRARRPSPPCTRITPGAVISSVLIASQPTSEGVAVCVAQHARAALDRGYDVTVVCPGADRGPLARWVTEAGANHVGLDMARGPGPSDVSHIRVMRRLMSGLDLVHAHSSKAGALTRLAAMTMRRPPPIIFSPHAWSWHVGGGMSRLYLSIERVLAKQTDVFVAVGEREAAEGRAALPAGEMVVVPNGVDVEFWAPDGPVAPRPPGPLVVCVGRLSKQKGQDLAIRALAGMRNADVTLRLLGDGPARDEMQDLADALGVSDRVEFWGSVSDPDRHLRAADIVVIPSRWDGMSLALLEAMAVGKAIVATDVAGTEVVGDAGIIVPIEDVPSLRSAMEELLDEEGHRRQLAIAARQAALRHSLDENLRALISVWERMIEPRSVTRPRTPQPTG